jgi:hypothetical protein
MNAAFGNDHEGYALIAESRIEAEAQRGKEGFGFVQVLTARLKMISFFMTSPY